jgi:hypothetical protein
MINKVKRPNTTTNKTFATSVFCTRLFILTRSKVWLFEVIAHQKDLGFNISDINLSLTTV